MTTLPQRTPPPAVVLVRPREEGNVGAACRAMANMGLHELRLVEPAAELGGMARAFAVGARDVLEGARRFGSLAEALGPFRRVVGTTSARDRVLSVPVVTPRALAVSFVREPDLPTALVFGSEVGGLTNDELALCHQVVTIPAALAQPTLNLAQAVLLVAYELYLVQEVRETIPEPAPEAPAGVSSSAGAARGEAGVEAPGVHRPQAPAEPRLDLEPPAPAARVEGLFEHLERVLREVGFARDRTFHGVLRDLRQLAGRARPTEREVTILRGVLRRIQNALRRASEGPSPPAPDDDAGRGPAGASGAGDNIPPP